MKRFVLTAAFFQMILLVFAQPKNVERITEVRAFPFGNPFSYRFRPAMDEASGMSDLFFLGQSVFIGGTDDQKYFRYDASWHGEPVTKGVPGNLFRAQSTRYLVLGLSSGTDTDTRLWVFDKRNMTVPKYSMDAVAYSGSFV